MQLGTTLRISSVEGPEHLAHFESFGMRLEVDASPMIGVRRLDSVSAYVCVCLNARFSRQVEQEYQHEQEYQEALHACQEHFARRLRKTAAEVAAFA